MKTVTFKMNELPPTLNDIIGAARKHKFASAAMKKVWGTKICLAASHMEKISGKVYLECVWRVKNPARDPDNIAAALKFPLDALVSLGVIKDDSTKVIKSPVIHHIVITDDEGFTLIFRDKSAFKKRLHEDLSKPPLLL